jgi:starvation-inducible outer membrane lipoprotein
MLATINTPTVQAPFGVSLLHPVLSIQGYDQNYMNYLQTKYKFYLIPFGNIYLFSIYDVILIKTKVTPWQCRNPDYWTDGGMPVPKP